MSLFLNRSRRAGRFLEWKVYAFTVAAVLALTGIYFQRRWLTGLAIVVLVGAMLLRFLPGSPSGGQTGSGECDDAEDTPPAEDATA